MKVTIDVDLEKFRYSLVGGGYLLEEVKEKSDEELITILTNRIEGYISKGYKESKRYGLLDNK